MPSRRELIGFSLRSVAGVYAWRAGLLAPIGASVEANRVGETGLPSVAQTVRGPKPNTQVLSPGRGSITAALRPRADWLGTVRVGQFTGTTDDDTWPTLVDPQGWPLLNDSGRWGVEGVDLGANTEHNGKLYFFFGDVATKPGSTNHGNADLVASHCTFHPWMKGTLV